MGRVSLEIPNDVRLSLSSRAGKTLMLGRLLFLLPLRTMTSRLHFQDEGGKPEEIVVQPSPRGNVDPPPPSDPRRDQKRPPHFHPR